MQGHGPGQKVLVAGRREVGILRVEPVGHYAIRIAFDDLHDSGIYSWDYLHQLGREYADRWAEYERALAAKGLVRDPPKRKT
ncbi:gamma-butyrobetaine hydroxylase-like domain-containing protein [Dankookia sp. P2]|uniref:gamma-butyrobetaine hydroxylase-like domain-containing protein n=1 Tax=Dankookia sp. P2 TaxID=3423955 RepID=UPI003D66C470